MRKCLAFISMGFVHIVFLPFSLIVVDSAELMAFLGVGAQWRFWPAAVGYAPQLNKSR